MYGEVRLEVNGEYIYTNILNIDYELNGNYIPEIIYPVEKCREAEYPEMSIKYIVIDNVDNIDYNNVTELKIVELSLDIEPFEYATTYEISSWYVKDSVTILEVV